MKNNVFRATLAASVAIVAVSSIAHGQIVGRATQQDWANSGGDAQRTNWQRVNPGSPAAKTISPETVAGAKIDFSSPDEMSGFGLQLKEKLENTARNFTAISGGATITQGGLGLNLAVVGASGNSTIGIDMDTGYPFYVTKHGGENPAGSLQCPGSSTVTPARPATLNIPRPGSPAPVNDRSGQIGWWSQSYAPGLGLASQRVGTEAGPIAAMPAVAANAAQAGRGGGAPTATPAAPATPINPVAAAIGSAQRGSGALPESPTGRLPVLYGVVGALERTSPGSFGPTSGGTFVVSNDGKAHILTTQYGLDAVEPMPFVPVGAQITDMINVSNVVYTSTINGCGGAPNGVWGISVIGSPRGVGSETDPRPGATASAAGGGGGGGGGAAAAPGLAPGVPPLPARGQVFKWETGGTASPSAVTLLPSGAALISTGSGTGMGDSIITLNTPSMGAVTQAQTFAFSLRNRFTQAGADFVGAPIVIPTTPHVAAAGAAVDQGGGLLGAAPPVPTTAPPAPGGNLIAAQARDGRIFILNEDLSAPLHVTAPVAGIGGYKLAGLSAWVDDTGQRWLLTTTQNSVIAYKLTATGNSVSLTQAWTLTGLQNPLAPIIVNGVVFAASSGEMIPAVGANPTIAQRVAGSRPARLYAVNALTGARIWDSGDTITSFIPRSSTLWASLGQVLLSTYDSTLYAFGANMERHSNKSIKMAY